MKIPEWLSHLRTDSHGRPVPFVNRWGPEDPARMSIGYDRWVDGPAYFEDDSGETEPDFLLQNPQRQRDCMLAGKCQVCARSVPWSRRFLVVSSRSILTLPDERYGAVLAVVEPWLDERCAEFAMLVCPGLIRRTARDDLTLVTITSKRQVQFTTERGWFEGSPDVQSQAVAPAMWAIAVPVSAPGFAPAGSEAGTSFALLRSADRALLSGYRGLTTDQKRELRRSWK